MKKAYAISIASLAICFSGYVLSYPLLLSTFEKSFLKSMTYSFYEPVEWLRNNSVQFWKITEWGYWKCGGKTYTGDRTDSKTAKRRNIVFYDDGKIRSDVFYANKKLLSAKFWNSYGKIHYKAYFDDKGKLLKTEAFNSNGNLSVLMKVKDFSNGKSEKSWHDNDGKKIAGLVSNEWIHPVTGSALYENYGKTKSIFNYLIFYQDGKEIARQLYFAAPENSMQNEKVSTEDEEIENNKDSIKLNESNAISAFDTDEISIDWDVDDVVKRFGHPCLVDMPGIWYYIGDNYKTFYIFIFDDKNNLEYIAADLQFSNNATTLWPAELKGLALNYAVEIGRMKKDKKKF